MNTIEAINDIVDKIFDFFSSIVGNIASNIAPLLTGLLPAYLTWKHIIDVLHYDAWVAWAGAGVIEFLGLGAGNELMKVWYHNRKYADEKKKMPILAPGAASVWYVLIMVIFNVILDAEPESLVWKIISVALFATLAIPSYALVAGKSLRKEWELERSKTLAERRAERNRMNQEPDGAGREDDNISNNSPSDEQTSEEQMEYASAYAEQIESILERVWLASGEIAAPAYIVRVLNDNGARLDPRKSSGYISTLTRNWRISRNIQMPVRPNGNGNGSNESVG